MPIFIAGIAFDVTLLKLAIHNLCAQILQNICRENLSCDVKFAVHFCHFQHSQEVWTGLNLKHAYTRAQNPCCSLNTLDVSAEFPCSRKRWLFADGKHSHEIGFGKFAFSDACLDFSRFSATIFSYFFPILSCYSIITAVWYRGNGWHCEFSNLYLILFWLRI